MGAAITSITGLQNLTNLQEFRADWNSLTTIDLSGLTNLTYVDISDNEIPGINDPSLTSVTLTGCTALDSLRLDDSDFSAGIPDLTGLNSLTFLDMDECNISGNVDLSILPALTSFDLSGNAGLTSVTIFEQVLNDVSLGSTALTEESVNDILQWLDGGGVLNGNVDLSDGGSAIPTGAGITAKDNLLAKGWSVNVNLPPAPFDVTADWSLTTPEVVDEASFRTFLESGEDGDGSSSNLTDVVITDFSLIDGRLRCNLSATGELLTIQEIDITSIISLGNITNLEIIKINNNIITEMPIDIFSQYTSLIELQINDLNIPVNLSPLINLETLYVNDYGYSTLDVSSLVNLKFFGGGFSSFAPSSLDFTNLFNLENVNLENGSIALTTVNISGCIGLTSITCYNTPTLTTILGLEDCSNISFVQLSGNGLDQTALDYIVVSIDDNGFSNGSITITGNPGTLSPVGQGARLNLISKGWTVNV
jgi:hypothetical protein